MLKNLLFIVLVLFVPSCKNATTTKVNMANNTIEEAVKALSTFEMQAQFLEGIGEADQRVRNDETKVITAYGYGSDQHNSSREEMKAVDKMNLEKIEKYLEIHGYPVLRDQGRIAVDVPWTVIQHAGSIEAMRRNFNHIYKAHSEDYQLRDIAITSYLNRMYQLEFGEPMVWDRPFKLKEELDTLMGALNLETF